MKKILIALIGLTTIPLAKADSLDDRLRISGFGTVGSVFNRNRGADYRVNSEQSDGVGLTRTRDYGVDSVFAIQGDAELAKDLTFTAQMESRRLSDGVNAPYFEWANVKYYLTDNLSVRVGRVVLPIFATSETRPVGYSRLPVRMPADVYQLVPLTYVDGGGVTYSMVNHNVLYRLNATAGKIKQWITVSTGTTIYSFKVGAANVAAEWGDSKFRIGYTSVTASLTNASLQLMDAKITEVAAAGVPNAVELRDKFQLHIPSDTWDMAYTYDRDNYYLQMEAIRRTCGSPLVQDEDAYFILGGYRIGKWTPYLQYSKMDGKMGRYDVPKLDATNLTGNTKALVTDLENPPKGPSLPSFRLPQERETWSIGTRWDLKENYAIKLQYDRVSKDANMKSYFVNATPSFTAKAQTVNIYSIALDFMF